MIIICLLEILRCEFELQAQAPGTARPAAREWQSTPRVGANLGRFGLASGARGTSAALGRNGQAKGRTPASRDASQHADQLAWPPWQHASSQYRSSLGAAAARCSLNPPSS